MSPKSGLVYFAFLAGVNARTAVSFAFAGSASLAITAGLTAVVMLAGGFILHGDRLTDR